MRCLSCQLEFKGTLPESCSQCGQHLATQLRDLLKPGQNLHHGKYRIEYPLGRGGFGVTYLARHVLLDKKVAIKEYFPQELSERVLGTDTLQTPTSKTESFQRGLFRFLREGRILGQIKHPHIVGVEDFFTENETAYLVMEYLQGKTLQTELNQVGGKLSPERVQELGAEIVSALSALHAQEVFHLDLKPENLVLEASGVKLIDFGSARPMGTGQSQSTRSLTQAYAPLELLSNGALGAYSDIFELGMLLYELLKGEKAPEVMQRVLKSWQPQDLPEPWLDLLAESLRLNPSERPQDIEVWWEGTFGRKETAREKMQKEQAGTQRSLTQKQEELEREKQSRIQVEKVVQLQPKREEKSQPKTFNNSLGMEFVWIQPGTFLMGSPESEVGRKNDEVLHEVTLTRGYYLQKTPVTQAQWHVLMRKNPSEFECESHPVECISWDDCQKFIQKLDLYPI